MAYYSDFDLDASQAAQWITETSANLLTHTVAGFGWMTRVTTEEPNPYHIVQVRNHFARIRELLCILEKQAMDVGVDKSLEYLVNEEAL